MTERMLGELHQSCASPAPPAEEEMSDSGLWEHSRDRREVAAALQGPS